MQAAKLSHALDEMFRGSRQLLPVDIWPSDYEPKLVIDRIVGGANHRPINKNSRQYCEREWGVRLTEYSGSHPTCANT